MKYNTVLRYLSALTAEEIHIIAEEALSSLPKAEATGLTRKSLYSLIKQVLKSHPAKRLSTALIIIIADAYHMDPKSVAAIVQDMNVVIYEGDPTDEAIQKAIICESNSKRDMLTTEEFLIFLYKMRSPDVDVATAAFITLIRYCEAEATRAIKAMGLLPTPTMSFEDFVSEAKLTIIKKLNRCYDSFFSGSSHRTICSRMSKYGVLDVIRETDQYVDRHGAGRLSHDISRALDRDPVLKDAIDAGGKKYDESLDKLAKDHKRFTKDSIDLYLASSHGETTDISLDVMLQSTEGVDTADRAFSYAKLSSLISDSSPEDEAIRNTINAQVDSYIEASPVLSACINDPDAASDILGADTATITVMFREEVDKAGSLMITCDGFDNYTVNIYD